MLNAHMVSTLRYDTTGLSTVKMWSAETTRSKKSLDNDSYVEIVSTEENSECVHYTMMDGRRLAMN